MSEYMSARGFCSVREFCQRQPWVTKGTVRRWIYVASQNDRNGFRACFKRVGGRIFLHEPSVLDWIEERDAAAREQEATNA